MNRRLTSAIAARHFAPTRQAAENLRAENVPADRIDVTGNTVTDALLSGAIAHGTIQVDANGERLSFAQAPSEEGRP